MEWIEVILQEGLPQLGLGEVASGGLELGSLHPPREPQEDTFGVRAAQQTGKARMARPSGTGVQSRGAGECALPPLLSLAQLSSG